MIDLNKLAEEIHKIAIDHGWWDNNPSFPEIIALCHSELSEALEERRTGHQVEVAPTAKKKKCPPHRAIIHYTERNGNEQYALQRLAADILNHGSRVAECHHTSQEFHPNGEQRTIMTGSYCIEVLNDLTGTRYWLHFNGCRITEIIEEYLED